MEVNSPGVVVRCLCLWLGFVGPGLELVKVRQLFPVVVLVLVGVVMVGAHNVISYVGLRLLRPWGSELERGEEKRITSNGQNEGASANWPIR